MQTDIIVAILTSSVVGSIVTRIFTILDRYKRSEKIDRMLILNAIKSQATEAIWNKYITSDDLKCLEEFYDEYHKLGGNGYADTLMAKARDLPLINEDCYLPKEDE